MGEGGACWGPGRKGTALEPTCARPCQHALEAGQLLPCLLGAKEQGVHSFPASTSGRSGFEALFNRVCAAHARLSQYFRPVGWEAPQAWHRSPFPQLMNARQDGVLLLTLGDLRWGRL